MPKQNGRHFADGISQRIYFNENFWVLFKTSLKFVPKDPIDNLSALVQVMAWRLEGNKPLPELMLTKMYDSVWCH